MVSALVVEGLRVFLSGYIGCVASSKKPLAMPCKNLRFICALQPPPPLDVLLSRRLELKFDKKETSADETYTTG